MAITSDQARGELGLLGVNRTLYINLFGTAAVTIGTGSVAGSFNCLTGGGYAEGTLTGTVWSHAAAGGTSTYSYAGTYTNTFTGSLGNAQGYTITTSTTGTFAAMQGSLVAVENFATPQMISANGDVIKVIPQIKMV